MSQWDTELMGTLDSLLEGDLQAAEEERTEAQVADFQARLTQATLPIHSGGLGLQLSAPLMDLSYMCSWVNCAPYLAQLEVGFT